MNSRQKMGDGSVATGGMIVRENKPENLEFPFWRLDGPITPNERFYVRSHFPEVPTLDKGTWRLKVEGAGVERPFEIGYEELVSLPSVKATVTLECAGNGRVFLTPKVPGAQWEMGAVSTAEWTGAPLWELLKRAGVKASAVEVILEGADAGEIKEEPKSPGEISFARSLPLAKAREGAVLLAYRMNGEELPPAHGFPLRAVVPGWYGMASVKWLTRLVVVEQPFTGYFQTADYSYWERDGGLPAQMRPITEVEVKAQIARPTRGEVVLAGSAYRVYGAAWGGESPVSKVEVSTDGGKSWHESHLMGKPVPHAWRLWEYEWHVQTKARKCTLLARATDGQGRAQPTERDANRGTYLISHILPVEIEVR